MAEDKLKKLVSICKQRGIIFPGSEAYGGLANTWDYGPLGVELKNNVKREWWKYFVQWREDMVGLDSAILMHPKVWQASGHLSSFNDPMVDCKQCKSRLRADKLLEEKLNTTIAGKSLAELGQMLTDNKIACPQCGSRDFTDVRSFNLMFKTFQGAVEDTASVIYLRPETAQGIFVDFNNIIRASRKKLPFGIAQIGKSFRNEITPGNFTFRTREFEQMEIEYFVKPGTEKEHFQKWVQTCWEWYLDLGINKDKIRLREHEEDELSHYSNGTVDLEYEFPFGWGELLGVASRTDFDLSKHTEFSLENYEYQDPFTKEKYIPYVIEPSFGADRTVLTFLIDALVEETLEKGKRNVLKLDKRLAPVKVAILPLARNVPEIVSKARELFDDLKKMLVVQYDDTGAIGKLYRRQDEVGTPYCVTVDHATVKEDNKVTVRNRDTMEQIRVELSQLKDYFKKEFEII